MAKLASRPWTVMVYMAGDNNLEEFGRHDLAEMSRSGASDSAHLVAQLDAMSDGQTRRYVITQSTDPVADCADEFPSVNTGDPSALVGFVKWAVKRCPAERYALVLWNHGGGWKDADIYAAVRREGAAAQRNGFNTRAIAKAKRALFRATIAQAISNTDESNSRGILYDDTSMDFLDNVEMRRALRQIVGVIGHKLDLLGFDACLMNMLEVHAQVSDLCEVIVGSQEVEPGSGWAYERALAALADTPDISAAELGRHIVRAYADAARAARSANVTQSAVQASKLQPTVSAVNALATALQAELRARANTAGRIFSALRATQAFHDPDYVDLLDLCRNVVAEFGPDTAVGQASARVVKSLTGVGTPILASATVGSRMARAHGLSIYLPTRNVSPLYRTLEFAQGSWDEFISAFAR